jgi:hypothetical protein
MAPLDVVLVESRPVAAARRMEAVGNLMVLDVVERSDE